MNITDGTTATRPPWSAPALAVATAIVLAGCGGSSGNTSPRSTSKPSLLAYAQCIRKHGVPNFPDPSSSGQLDLSGVNPQSPAYQTAANDCKSFGVGLTPKAITQTPQVRAGVLKMANCMRSHGVPNYPDGPITRSSGINESSPAFQRAFQRCSGYMTGSGQVPVTGG